MRLVCKATGNTANFRLYQSINSDTPVDVPIVDGIIDFEVGSEYVGISLSSTPTITEVLHLPQLNYITLNSAFLGLDMLTTLDLSYLDVSNLANISGCFYTCINLQSLNLSTWGALDKITSEDGKMLVFNHCDSLTHIKCKTAFRDWCWANASDISLPAAMQEGGSGTWELTD